MRAMIAMTNTTVVIIIPIKAGVERPFEDDEWSNDDERDRVVARVGEILFDNDDEIVLVVEMEEVDDCDDVCVLMIVENEDEDGNDSVVDNDCDGVEVDDLGGDTVELIVVVIESTKSTKSQEIGIGNLTAL